MTHRILLIQGHPDANTRHLNHLLLDAYAQGAAAAGHETRTLVVADLEFPLLRTQDDWEKGTVPEGLRDAQADILWADHLVLFFPLWLGDMPALLKGFLEQVARPGFAFHRDARNPFGAKALERNVLGFIGIAPVRETLIGMVAGMPPETVARWESKMRRLGGRAE